MGISWQKLCHTLFCNGVVQRTFYKNASAGWPLIFQPGSIFVQQIPYVSTIGAFYSSCWGTPNQEKKMKKGGLRRLRKEDVQYWLRIFGMSENIVDIVVRYRQGGCRWISAFTAASSLWPHRHRCFLGGHKKVAVVRQWPWKTNGNLETP